MSTTATRAVRVGMMPQAAPRALHRAMRVWRARRPELSVEVREIWAGDRDLDRIGSGDVDLALVLGPLERLDLQVRRVAVHPRRLVLSPDHPLAARASVDLAEAVDQPTFRRPEEVDPSWRSFWLAESDRGGPPAYAERRASSILDAAARIGTSRAVGWAPAGWGAGAGLREVRVEGLTPCPILVATPRGPLSRGVQDLVDLILAEVATGVGVRSAGVLTEAEERVAGLVAEGLTNSEIAARLCLSPRTVESQVASAVRRLHLRSRAHLAAWSARAG